MREVDIVLERDDGMIAGIEVKASATVKAGDFGGLRALAEACGDRFAFGVVLYDNTDVVPFGDKLAIVQHVGLRMVAEANGRTTQYIVGQRISSREKKKSEKFGKSLSGYATVARLIGRAHLKAARGKEIGQQLGLSHRTIEHRVERLKQGFGARSTSQLVALAIADGLESAD